MSSNSSKPRSEARPRHHRALAAIVLALAAGLVGCSSEVLHDVPEVEANEILTVLQEHDVDAEKVLEDAETNTWKIAVPSKSAAYAWSILSDYKLPRQREPRIQDVFGGDGLVRTPMQEEALYKAALEGELSHTLETVQGIIDSRVHLVMPRTDLTGRVVGDAKASVYVEYQPQITDAGQEGTKPIDESEIQRMVANAVEDLEAANVAVVLKPATRAAPSQGQLQGGFVPVDVGPLRLDEKTLPELRLIAAIVVVLIIALGGLLVFQSRTVSRLRAEVKALRGAGRTLEKPAEAGS